VSSGVVGGRAVEQRPVTGGGTEGQGVLVLLQVSAGDVQDAVGVAAVAFEDEVASAAPARVVGAGDLGEEVFRAGLALLPSTDGYRSASAVHGSRQRVSLRLRWSDVVGGQGRGRTADLPLFRSNGASAVLTCVLAPP
jgi:hypothetical protein